MNTYVATLKSAALMPFDYWKTAAADGKFLIKNIDLATSIHRFAVNYVPDSVLVHTFDCLGTWARPATVIFKPWTDGIEPLKDVLQNGSKLIAQKKYVKLAAKVSLVAGLFLSIPVYLSSIGVFSLGVLTTNVATVGSLKAIALIQSSLIVFGTAYKFSEADKKIDDKEAELDCAEEKREYWDNADEAPADGSTLRQKKWIAAKQYQIADYELKKAKADWYDASTKIALFAVTIFSAYVAPIQGAAVVIATSTFNKAVGCYKDYQDVKERELKLSVEKWRRDEKLNPSQMNADMPKQHGE